MRLEPDQSDHDLLADSVAHSPGGCLAYAVPGLVPLST